MTSGEIGERLNNYFGAGQSLGWLILAVVGIGIAHGMLRTDVDRNRQEIERMDNRMASVFKQISLIREKQSGSAVNIGNIKEDIQEIKIDVKVTRDGIQEILKATEN